MSFKKEIRAKNVCNQSLLGLLNVGEAVARAWINRVNMKVTVSERR